MSLFGAYIISVLGNMVPVFFCFYFIVICRIFNEEICLGQAFLVGCLKGLEKF